MKIYKLRIKTVLLSTLLLGTLSLSSCMDEELNRRGGRVSEDELKGDNYNLGASFPAMTDLVVPAQENHYQMAENLIGDLYSRYMMFTKDAWGAQNNPPLYNVPTSWYSSPFNYMAEFYKEYVKVKEETGGEGINFAWAQILKVGTMVRLTDMYGPLPYSKVNSNALAVAYDSQEEAYKAMFEDLNSAIEVLSNYASANPNATPMAKYDNVYNGKFSQWVKYANSLKLRMAIRIRFANPTLAKQMAEEAVSHTFGVITDNADNATYYYEKSHPLKIMWDDYNDCRVCADIIAYTTGYQDNRAEKFFQKATGKWDGTTYVGLRSGIKPVNLNLSKQYSAPNVAKADRLIWLTAAEVAFCRSEGAMLGWNMGGTAQAFYEEGIKLSFEQWGASGADGYLANETNTPAGYEDPSGTYQSASAPSDITIKWNESDSNERKLERIITQKWIALWPLGQEAWSEMRRTGYPKVFKLEQSPKYPVDVPNRLPFAYDEYQNNKANVEAAAATLNGADTYQTKIWWQRTDK